MHFCYCYILVLICHLHFYSKRIVHDPVFGSDLIFFWLIQILRTLFFFFFPPSQSWVQHIAITPMGMQVRTRYFTLFVVFMSCSCSLLRLTCKYSFQLQFLGNLVYARGLLKGTLFVVFMSCSCSLLRLTCKYSFELQFLGNLAYARGLLKGNEIFSAIHSGVALRLRQDGHGSPSGAVSSLEGQPYLWRGEQVC